MTSQRILKVQHEQDLLPLDDPSHRPQNATMETSPTSEPSTTGTSLSPASLSTERLWTPSQGIRFSQGLVAEKQRDVSVAGSELPMLQSRNFSSTPPLSSRRLPVLFGEPDPEPLSRAELLKALKNSKEPKQGQKWLQERENRLRVARQNAQIQMRSVKRANSAAGQHGPKPAAPDGISVLHKVDSNEQSSADIAVTTDVVATAPTLDPASGGELSTGISPVYAISDALQKNVDLLSQEDPSELGDMRGNYFRASEAEQELIRNMKAKIKHEPSLLERTSMELQLYELVESLVHRQEDQSKVEAMMGDANGPKADLHQLTTKSNARYRRLRTSFQNVATSVWAFQKLIDSLKADSSFGSRHGALLEVMLIDAYEFILVLRESGHKVRRYLLLKAKLRDRVRTASKEQIVVQQQIRWDDLLAPFHKALGGMYSIRRAVKAHSAFRKLSRLPPIRWERHKLLASGDGSFFRDFCVLQKECLDLLTERSLLLPPIIDGRDSLEIAFKKYHHGRTILWRLLERYHQELVEDSEVNIQQKIWYRQWRMHSKDIIQSFNDLHPYETLLNIALERDQERQLTIYERTPGHATSLDSHDVKAFAYDYSHESVERARDASSEDNHGLPWSYKFYLNQESQSPSIQVCVTRLGAHEALARFFNEPVIGFDLEWLANSRSSDGIKKNVSLIQIASESRILLIHVARFDGDTAEDIVPLNLKVLLENPNIIKAGVAIDGDCTRLERTLGIRAKSIFELSHMHRLVKYSNTNPEDIWLINRRLVSLAIQVEEHLGMPMKKDEVRSGAWDRPLTLEQIEYAASDAYASHRLFYILNNKRLKLDPVPPLPRFSEEKHPILVANGQTVPEFCQEHGISRPRAANPDPVAEESEDESTLARDFMDLSTGERPVPSTSRPTKLRATQKRPSRARPTSSCSTPANPHVLEAEEWARATRARISAKQGSSVLTKILPSHLKAYYLWQHRDMDVGTISELLRDVPLKVATVASYIVQAVRFAKLPCDKDRFEEVEEMAPRFGYGFRKG